MPTKTRAIASAKKIGSSVRRKSSLEKKEDVLVHVDHIPHHCPVCDFVPMNSMAMIAVLSGLVVALSMFLMQAMLFL